MFHRVQISLSGNQESLSKSKKQKSARSRFYSALMKRLGGDTGENLAQAFTKGESEKFRKLMNELCDAMEAAEKKQAHASDISLSSELFTAPQVDFYTFSSKGQKFIKELTAEYGKKYSVTFSNPGPGEMGSAADVTGTKANLKAFFSEVFEGNEDNLMESLEPAKK